MGSTASRKKGRRRDECRGYLGDQTYEQWHLPSGGKKSQIEGGIMDGLGWRGKR